MNVCAGDLPGSSSSSAQSIWPATQTAEKTICSAKQLIRTVTENWTVVCVNLNSIVKVFNTQWDTPQIARSLAFPFHSTWYADSSVAIFPSNFIPVCFVFVSQSMITRQRSEAAAPSKQCPGLLRLLSDVSRSPRFVIKANDFTDKELGAKFLFLLCVVEIMVAASKGCGRR